MKQTERDAINLATSNGIVYAGRNYPPENIPLDDRARMARVHHATITALVRRGVLAACRSSEGGYAARLAFPLVAKSANT